MTNRAQLGWGADGGEPYHPGIGVKARPGVRGCSYGGVGDLPSSEESICVGESVQAAKEQAG